MAHSTLPIAVLASASPFDVEANSLRRRIFKLTWRRAVFICLLVMLVVGYFIVPYYSDSFHLALGNDYYSKGDYDHAIEEYTAAIQSNSKDESAYVNRGLAYTFKYDYTNAEADYEKAIQMNPQDYYAYYARGLNLYHQYDYGGAIAQFTQSLNLNVNFDRAYYYRGMAYEQTSQNSAAIADFKKVLQISRDPSL